MSYSLNYFSAKKQIKDKKINNIYILIGEDENLKNDIILTLKSVLSRKNSLEEQKFSGLETPLDKIILAVRSNSFFGENNLIVIYNSESLQLKFLQEIKSFILNPILENYLVFVFANSKLPKQKEQYLTSQDLLRLKSKFVNTIICSFSSEIELRTYIKEECKKQGKEIAESALHTLTTYSKNTLLISNEIEKVITFIGEKNIIDNNDLELIIIPTLEDNVFNLVRNIFEEKKQDVFKLISDLLANKIEPLNLLNVLIWQIRLVWQAKFLLEEGYLSPSKNIFQDIKNIPEKVIKILPLGKKCLLQNSNFVIRRAVSIAKATSREKIYFMLRKLYETDLILKGINFKLNDKITLEILLANLLEDEDGVITSRNTAKN